MRAVARIRQGEDHMSKTAEAVVAQEFDRDPTWGPMSHPVTEAIESGSPPWKDHIYAAFWDVSSDCFGFFHWNSSPNHDTGKSQLSGSFGGTAIDIKESLEPRADRFQSQSLDFDLRGAIAIDHERVRGRLTAEPRLTPVDYTQNSLLPPLVPDEPLQHWQQGFSLTGELTVDGQERGIAALGYRTRTWGFRDDSNQFQEYVSLQTCMRDRDITVMKFRWPDGSLKTDGFVVSAGDQIAVVDLHVVRNSAGLTTRLTLDLEGGDSLMLERRGCAVGLWCPIGLPEREGPTFAAYDEIIEWELDGERAHSIVEQAIVRHVY
jgi:hypothetical protein